MVVKSCGDALLSLPITSMVVMHNSEVGIRNVNPGAEVHYKHRPVFINTVFESWRTTAISSHSLNVHILLLCRYYNAHKHKRLYLCVKLSFRLCLSS
jgi:hypothetical protein